jgi:predicted phage terminase large subunit-like protein
MLLVEGKGSGISLIQQVQANNIDPDFEGPRIPVLPMPANVQKVVRAHGISGYHAEKLILLPRSAEWKDDFVDEHAIFDKGPHDDWVDCTVHGITYYTREVKDNEHEETIIDDTEVTISAELDELEGVYI